MEDIELVIKMPEEKYKWIKENHPKADKNSIVGAIVYGTPLPKGHGDLIYRNDVITDLRNSKKGFWRHKDFIKGEPTTESMAYEINDIKYVLKNVQTIIEADKGETE